MVLDDCLVDRGAQFFPIASKVLKFLRRVTVIDFIVVPNFLEDVLVPDEQIFDIREIRMAWMPLFGNSKNLSAHCTWQLRPELLLFVAPRCSIAR